VLSRRTSLTARIAVDRSRVLDTLVNNLDGMAYRCRNDEHWTMQFVSNVCRALTGYAPEEVVENARVSWELLTHADDCVRVREELSAALAEGRRFRLEYRIVAADGEVKWVLERGIGVVDENGELVIEGFIEDITDRHRTQEALENAELRYRHIFEHASEGIFQTTSDGQYLAANQALATLYGYETPDELMAGLSDIEHQLYVDPERREQFRRLMEVRGEVKDFESEVYRRDGTRIWITENAHVVRDARGEFLCYEGTVEDITERRSYQERLERQANHDLLTGLPNRSLLLDRLDQAMARAARLSYYVVVVFIDLDNFKFINDSLGHGAGDELLKEIGRRLCSCLRNSDTVARLGGDEFVLVLNDHYQIETVISLLERVLAEIARPVELAGRDFQVGASLGVALYPQDGADAPQLLKHADVAMYAAKDSGRNNFQFFTPELNRITEERLHLEAAMRAGLERGEFSVAYQPKVDHARRVVGVEALARWHSAEHGFISPDRFIPIAEETGLIVPLTESILRQAFAAARRWQDIARQPVQLAVNLSPRLFLDRDLVDKVGALMREAGIAPSLVELEITESVLIGDSERTIGVLRDFKELGVRLAMDDFGTGYSSLSYLRRLPLDIIKIDRSLVNDVEREDEPAMIARAAISLGRSLRKTVVAEGVENPEQFEFLRNEGCDEFQGYLIAKPMPEEQFLRLLGEPGDAAKSAADAPALVPESAA
jgi:diguanylate cyclase (GGDEF)-like protein/PAS domain S-box-containing protein